MRPVHTPGPIFAATLELLERLCAVSSPSGDLAGLEAAARLLADALERRGMRVEIRREPGADGRDEPVLHARTGAASDRHLLAVGHLDTVLAAAAPARRGDRLIATGAIDMKGGLAALAGALELLAARGERPPDDLLLAVVPDEEVAGHLSRHVVETLGARARGLWVLEPGQPRGAGETIVAGRRGFFDWRLDVRGRSAHAGNAYWDGRSALTAAAEWCLEARKLAAPGPGPTVNAGRLVAGEAGFVADLAAGAALVGTPRQLNVVPDRALAEGEARFLKAADGEALRTALAELTRRLAAAHRLEMELDLGATVPPVDPGGPGRAWSEAAAELAGRAGWTLEIEDDRGGISFSNFLPDPSAVPVLDGLGPVGGGMHTREEFLDLRSLDRRIALLADLLLTPAPP